MTMPEPIFDEGAAAAAFSSEHLATAQALSHQAKRLGVEATPEQWSRDPILSFRVSWPWPHAAGYIPADQEERVGAADVWSVPLTVDLTLTWQRGHYGGDYEGKWRVEKAQDFDRHILRATQTVTSMGQLGALMRPGLTAVMAAGGFARFPSHDQLVEQALRELEQMDQRMGLPPLDEPCPKWCWLAEPHPGRDHQLMPDLKGQPWGFSPLGVVIALGLIGLALLLGTVTWGLIGWWLS